MWNCIIYFRPRYLASKKKKEEEKKQAERMIKVETPSGTGVAYERSMGTSTTIAHKSSVTDAGANNTSLGYGWANENEKEETEELCGP